MAKSKPLIRKEFIELREKQSLEDVVNKSTIIINKLINLNLYGKSKVVMGYMDFRNEVVTEYFLKESIRRGKKVAIPRIEVLTNGSKGIVPYMINDIHNQVEKGTFGVREPIRSRNIKLQPEEFDLIVVPGVAFDIRGFRIGFGAGYYDRFLEKVRPDCIKIGIAFDMQIVEELSNESHDIPMDIVISEKRIII